MRSLRHARAPSGEHLVRVRLVTHVPHKAIMRRIEDVMQARSSVRRCPGSMTEWPPVLATDSTRKVAQLVGQLRQLSAIELAQL
jgi:hypothetical protein